MEAKPMSVVGEEAKAEGGTHMKMCDGGEAGRDCGTQMGNEFEGVFLQGCSCWKWLHRGRKEPAYRERLKSLEKEHKKETEDPRGLEGWDVEPRQEEQLARAATSPTARERGRCLKGRHICCLWAKL